MASPGQSPRKAVQYTYTPLDSLTGGARVNVYGVVKFANANREIKKSGKYFKTIGIYDEALWRKSEKLMITIFASSEEWLPDCHPRDIIRIHRLQLENFHNTHNGKLQMEWGGAWALFGDADGFIPHSASSKDPSWSPDERWIIAKLRDWLNSENPGDDLDNNLTSNFNAVSSHNTADPAGPDTWIRDIHLKSYSCITGQLLQRSVLLDNEDKIALLKVWDGTRLRLELNKPSMGDFSSETHGCGVLEQLPDCCATLVVYGRHIARAKQLKLGGVYRFTGVHCVEYASVGKPELYLHERNRSLAMPLSAADKNVLVDQLISSVRYLDNVTLDITADSRSVKELDDELQLILESPSKNNNARSERRRPTTVQQPTISQTTKQRPTTSQTTEQQPTTSQTTKQQPTTSQTTEQQPTTSKTGDSCARFHFHTDKNGVEHHLLSRECFYLDDDSLSNDDRRREVSNEHQGPDGRTTTSAPKKRSTEEILREYQHDNYLLECMIAGSDLKVHDPPAIYFTNPVAAVSALRLNDMSSRRTDGKSTTRQPDELMENPRKVKPCPAHGKHC